MDIKQKLKKDHLVWNEKDEMDIMNLGNLLWHDNIEEFFELPVAKHKILFLVNGLGSSFLDTLSDDSLLKQNKRMDLYSVIPTTELNTLISFYRNMSPGAHGILGEYQHDRTANVSYSYTTFLDRTLDRNLSIYGLNPKELYQFPKVEKCKKKKYVTMMPNSILIQDSYKAILEGLHVVTYHGLSDIPSKLKRITTTSLKGTTTVIYVTELETMMQHGAKESEIEQWIRTFTDMVFSLKQKNNTVMVSSLHGCAHVDASIILNYAKYNKYFYALPAIEKRMTSFYIKPEYEKEFTSEFKKDYGHLLGLYKLEDFIKLGIFKDDTQLKNYGEYISVNLEHNYLEIPINEDLYMEQLNNPEYKNACSGGMSKEEVIVPLIIL